MTLKIPAEIAVEHATKIAQGDSMVHATPEALSEFLRCAIEADRAQRNICRHCGAMVKPMPNPEDGTPDWIHTDGMWGCVALNYAHFAAVAE